MNKSSTPLYHSRTELKQRKLSHSFHSTKIPQLDKNNYKQTRARQISDKSTFEL
uniref:Uncharacterized protein n=1 Tax=Arundo donax TaxID=35708 RepID=A0A0A9EG46_ARUDO